MVFVSFQSHNILISNPFILGSGEPALFQKLRLIVAVLMIPRQILRDPTRDEVVDLGFPKFFLG